MSGLLIWMISATARICGSSPTPLSGSAARSSSRSPSAARFSEALKVATRRFTTLPRGREGWGAAWAAAGRPNPAAAAAANARRRVTRGVMHPLCTFDSKGRNRSVDAGTPHPLRPAARWRTEPMRIAFLGTGRMGTELALRLIPDHDLTVWNRTAGRTARLAEAGAAGADTAAAAGGGADLGVTSLFGPDAVQAPVIGAGPIPAGGPWGGPAAAAVEGADLVVTSLFGPDAVQETVIGPGLIPAGVPWVDTTTVSPADAEGYAAVVPTYVAVPVVGSLGPARSGALGVCVGTPDEALRARVLELVAPWADPERLWCVDSARKAATGKLLANLVLAVSAQGLREAL